MRPHPNLRLALASMIVCTSLWLAPAFPRAAESGPAPITPAGHGTRVLYLIRHGIYDETDPRSERIGKALTPLGREQARIVGLRLAGLPSGVSHVHASTLTRARETAEIVVQALPGRGVEPDSDLCECTPATPRQDVMRDLAPGEADSCRSQLERVVVRYFRPTSGPDSSEALVCHGNVIRYLVCRALGADPIRWLSMMIGHCSVTTIHVRPDGTCRLAGFSDVGHLPVEMQTYAGARMAPVDSLKRK
ncbi:MAG: histidine phosphatase family protein [Candidatus Eisenbacteria bacterium]|nr:histidine phosphatase family protein [Candidatus Eisenbacteria bacterium]